MAESSSDLTPEEIKAAYKEKLRSLTMRGGHKDGKYVYRPKPDMSWEKGIQGEHRAGGTFMPYVRASDLTPITAKQMADNRGHFETQLSDLRRGAPPKE